MSGKVEITERIFDEVLLKDSLHLKSRVKAFTLDNGWMSVEVLNYGATVRSIKVPDRNDTVADIALGFSSMTGYMKTDGNPYFGATIGRVTNRIANGCFELDGYKYHLSKNEGNKTLHGGVVGFDRRMWKACVIGEEVIMTLESPHLDQGFPGELIVEAVFSLTPDNRFIIAYSARSDRRTPLNMTCHLYFNLAGHDAGPDELHSHSIMVNAEKYTPVDSDLVPTGEVESVTNTPYDLSTEKLLGDAILACAPSRGLDNNYCVTPEASHLVCRLRHSRSGRVMEVFSNQPGLQVYSGNYLDVDQTEGKNGASYTTHSGIALETQNYPDAINQPSFPSCVLQPGLSYNHCVVYKFGVEPLADSFSQPDSEIPCQAEPSTCSSSPPVRPFTAESKQGEGDKPFDSAGSIQGMGMRPDERPLPFRVHVLLDNTFMVQWVEPSSDTSNDQYQS